MARRLMVLLVLGCAVVAAPALGDTGLGQKKQQLDSQLAAAQAKIAASRAKEASLNKQIGGLNTQIQSLESRVSDVAGTLSALQADLSLRRKRLAALNSLYRIQTERVQFLHHEYLLDAQRLAKRLVAIYEAPAPTTIEVVLHAKSFQDALDELDYLSLVAKQDGDIAAAVAEAKQRVVVARKHTAQVRVGVNNEANKINARLQQVAIIHAQLLTSQSKLANARHGKSVALTIAHAQEQAAQKESQAIQAESAALEAKIRAAQAGDGNAPTATPSAAGFIWPVSGPITSPFGPRWGGFHPGIDIGVPEGTPIHAAAAGTVIYCSGESGYGNLVVIDHHNGLATAYAHQSRIAVGCGSNVTQGQVIGYSGCTGFCTGPHLHFEVRVNGAPVDPLGYLP
ncbi:MAG: murein hydrolase activator EnvC family protein [Gaiellaceae bacterium]